MAYHFRYQKSESFEKQLEESLYVVIQQHDSHTAVLRFEERAEGKAAKQVLIDVPPSDLGSLQHQY